MTHPDAIPARLSVDLEDRLRSYIPVPGLEIFRLVEFPRPRHAYPQFLGRTEELVAALDHRITLGGSHRTFDERSQRRLNSMQRMQLRHDTVITGNDDIRLTVSQSTPQVRQRK